MNITNALKPFISNQQNIAEYVYAALFEYLKIMNRALIFDNAYDFAFQSVN